MSVMTATAQEPASFPQPSLGYKKLGTFGNLSVGRVQPQTQAQSKTKITTEISVQELQVPAKAHQAVLQGVECMRKGDVAGSLSHFKRAIQECPSYPQAYYQKGLAEIRLDQPNEALHSFQKAIDLSGGHYALAYFGCAQALGLLESRRTRKRSRAEVWKRTPVSLKATPYFRLRWSWNIALMRLNGWRKRPLKCPILLLGRLSSPLPPFT
jgi:tetratricopeptide (TPR) repeat protein